MQQYRLRFKKDWLSAMYGDGYETWVWRIEKIKWINGVSNEEELKRVKERRLLLETAKGRKGNWIRHMISEKVILTTVLEGTVDRIRSREKNQDDK